MGPQPSAPDPASLQPMPAPAPRPRRRWLRRILLALAGLLLTMIVALVALFDLPAPL